MKMRELSSVVLAAVVLGVFSGCGVSQGTASKNYQNVLDGAPKWVINPQSEKGFNATGSAKIGNAGLQFAITEAEALARDSMAREIQVKVSNMVKNFTQQTGVGGSELVDKVVSSVSKQVSKQELVGSYRKEMWISPNNEVWVLMSISDQNTIEVKNAIKSSVNDSSAIYQQGEAKKAQEELTKEVEKL